MPRRSHHCHFNSKPAFPHGNPTSSPHSLLQTSQDASGILTEDPPRPVLAAVATPQAAPRAPPARGEALTGGAPRHLDDALGFPAHLPGVEGPDAHCHLHRGSRHGAGRTRALPGRSSGCPGKGRGEKGVRKTHSPIHTLQLCRVSGKPVRGILLGGKAVLSLHKG